MRVGLYGRGRLGSAIAAELDGDLVWQLGRDGKPAGGVDVAIDASRAEAVEGHVVWAIENATPLVIGTTGWSISDLAERVGTRTAVLVAPNFSLTVALMKRLTTILAGYAALDPDRDPYVSEAHHRHKADAPSGTARLLAQAVMAACPRKKAWTTGTPAGAHELSIGVVRAGVEVGTHVVGIDAPGEVLEIRHQVRSRAAFAQGAVAAARWLVGRSGVYSMDDVARDVLGPLFTP